MISTAVDKTTVAAGETITVTYTMNRAVDEVSLITIAPKYDKTVLTFQSVDYVDSVFFQSPKSGASALVGRGYIREERSRMTVNAGKLCSFTFVAAEDVEDVTEVAFYNVQSTSSKYNSCIQVAGKIYTTADGGLDHGESDPIYVNVTPKGATGPIATPTGYSVSMGADQTVAADQKVLIPVTVNSSRATVTGFNAYDMTFTYDPAALTLNTASDAAANLTVEDNNGTVRVRRYGETVPLGEALTLDFTAKKGATSTVTLTGAKFDLDANSINFDAPAATISDADTVVNANNFTVTLPDDFTSDAETRLVPAGGSFTFKPVDSHYTYTFTVKMGDTVKDGLTFGADDAYTVSGVNGNVKVTVTSKTPKKYDVTYRYLVNFKDLEVPEEILKGPATATYNEDYSFSIRPRNDTSYRVEAIWGMSTDTQTTLRGTANPDGTITYTLDKYFVKKDFTIRIMATPDNKYNVVFNGNGAEDVDPGAPSSVGANNPYYFKLNKREKRTVSETQCFRRQRACPI